MRRSPEFKHRFNVEADPRLSLNYDCLPAGLRRGANQRSVLRCDILTTREAFKGFCTAARGLVA